jgi:hypothetical protein
VSMIDVNLDQLQGVRRMPRWDATLGLPRARESK